MSDDPDQPYTDGLKVGVDPSGYDDRFHRIDDDGSAVCMPAAFSVDEEMYWQPPVDELRMCSECYPDVTEVEFVFGELVRDGVDVHTIRERAEYAERRRDFYDEYAEVLRGALDKFEEVSGDE